MASIIGKLAVKIGVDAEELEKGVKKATQATRSAANALGKFSLAATGSIAAMSAAIVKANLSTIDSLAKTSDKLGLTTEALQGLRHAAELTGVSAGTMDTAVQRMTRRISEAAKGTGVAVGALDELGISIDSIRSLSPDEQMLKISGAMSQVASQSDRVRLAMQLFDTEGVALVNTLGAGEQALKDMMGEVDALGASISRVDAAKIEQANDAFFRASTAASGFGKQLTVAVSPVLTELTNSFIGMANEAGGVGSVATRAFDAVVKAAGHVANAIRGIEIAYNMVKLGGSVMGQAMMQVFAAMARGVENYVNFSIAGINKLIGAANSLGANISTIGEISAGSDFFSGMAESFGIQADEIQEKITSLAMAELPSSLVEKFVANARKKSEADAQAVIDSAKTIAEGTNAVWSDTYTGPGSAAYTDMLVGQNAELNEILLQQDADAAQRRLGMSQQFLGNMANLMNAGSRKLFAIGKAAALGNAIVEGYAAISKTMAATPYPWNIPLAAAQAAASFANVKSILSTSYGQKSAGVTYSGGQATVPTTQTQVASINIVGSEGASFSGDQIRGLIGQINEAVGDGVQLRTN